MSTVITAGNATNGLSLSADNAGTFDFKTGTGAGTTAMAINASQNVGIGTTSPAAKLDVVGASGVTSFTGTSFLGMQVRGAASTNDYSGIGFSTTSQGFPTAKIAAYFSGNGSYLQFGTSNSYGSGITNTAVTIDYSGNLLVGTTSYAGAGISITKPDGSGCYSVFSGSSGGFHWRFGNVTNGIVGGISTTTTTTTYATSSDYRLKENVQPMVGALDKVSQLKPCTYTWKADESDGEGFIAHELQSVIPNAVIGEKDAVDENGNPVYQGIDTSFLVATLTAAIQELKAELDAVKAKVGA